DFGFSLRYSTPDGPFQSKGSDEEQERRQAEPRIRLVIAAILKTLRVAALQGVDGPAGAQQSLRVARLERLSVRDMGHLAERPHPVRADLARTGSTFESALLLLGSCFVARARSTRVDGVDGNVQSVGHLGGLTRRPDWRRLRHVVLAVAEQHQHLAARAGAVQ